MADTSMNAFEILFDQAASDPAKEGEFFVWAAKQIFVVPAEEALQALSPGTLPREIAVLPTSRIRLKAFSSPHGTAVPAFSDPTRFERWSAPDPQGRYVKLEGRALAALVPQGAALLLNPGSERFSKWFTPEEVLRLKTG